MLETAGPSTKETLSLLIFWGQSLCSFLSTDLIFSIDLFYHLEHVLKISHYGIHLTKDVQDLCSENYKM